jgi:hypothetical protein
MKDMVDMIFNGSGADREFIRDFRIALTDSQLREHSTFLFG